VCVCVCRRSRTYARTTCTTTRRHRLLLFAMDCINSPPNEIWSPRENADSAVAARKILSPSGAEENVSRPTGQCRRMSILFVDRLSVNTIDNACAFGFTRWNETSGGFHPGSRPRSDQLLVASSFRSNQASKLRPSYVPSDTAPATSVGDASDVALRIMQHPGAARGDKAEKADA